MFVYTDAYSRFVVMYIVTETIGFLAMFRIIRNGVDWFQGIIINPPALSVLYDRKKRYVRWKI